MFPIRAEVSSETNLFAPHPPTPPYICTLRRQFLSKPLRGGTPRLGNFIIEMIKQIKVKLKINNNIRKRYLHTEYR